MPQREATVSGMTVKCHTRFQPSCHAMFSTAFYALSYCWGSARRDKDVVCNGRLLVVTAHLKRGIQELQAIPLAGSWVRIDQISVNQDDPNERSHQVGLMRDIYVQAIRTIIWLGPSDGSMRGRVWSFREVVGPLPETGVFGLQSGLEKETPQTEAE